jgi:CMP-N-acetylneuraminic acid synthetase
MSKSTLAIIPARGGSKGLKRKCLCEVGGRSLLVRCIETALATHSVERVIVSTDDPEYAEVARGVKAEVPFLRPAELATDDASIIDAIFHLLENLQKAENKLPDFLLLVQPTSPFLIASDIDQAYSSFDESSVDAVCSVTECEVNPDWMRRIDARGYLEPLFKLDLPQHSPRQKMPVNYRLNGALYWIKTEVFLHAATFLPPRTVPFLMPSERSVDIDCEFDLKMANFISSVYNL